MPNINISNLKVKYKIKRNVYVDAINDLSISFKKNKFNVLYFKYKQKIIAKIQIEN